ncbi:hypothetical protein RFI_03656 [Reticulomyxa filosa]|uniref:Heat shock protein 90 n=1 Tax=Reticulomyxa filosa TaxID=46433 RepID=X6P5I7_RETFI|nr:hypothetical protein RFI_03656 [Reticulomyxa filosa]|eukprot:ETO33451.1 hypothetical protein RFI_03656 [Reticulomyxa filosa]
MYNKKKKKHDTNPDEKICIIRNTGIWMIKEDVVNNLGTIAQSGTNKFIEICQFDFGFYSAYLVSKRVVVRSRQSKRCKSDNEDEQRVWKNDCANFCKEKNLKELVKKHSQFVVFLVNLLTIKEEKVLCLCFICKISIDKSSELKSSKEDFCKMKEKQKYTYYITGESRANVKVSMFLEALNLEVLFLGPIDVSAAQQSREYDRKKCVCVTKVGLDLPLLKKKLVFFKKYTYLKKLKTLRIIDDEKVAYESLAKKMKEILGQKVEKVIVGYRMVYSTCSLVTSEYGWSANIERIMNAQALRDTSMARYMPSAFSAATFGLYVVCSSGASFVVMGPKKLTVFFFPKFFLNFNFILNFMF